MKNCITDNLSLINGLSEVAQHIAQHDVSQAHQSKVFGTLLEHAVTCSSKDEFFAFLKPFEQEVLLLREQQGERVRNGAGKYLHSKVSGTSTYRANKAVIGKALDTKTALFDHEGKSLGKSAIERAYKGSAAEGSGVSSYARACRLANELVKVRVGLTVAQQTLLSHKLRDGGYIV